MIPEYLLRDAYPLSEQAEALLGVQWRSIDQHLLVQQQAMLHQEQKPCLVEYTLPRVHRFEDPSTGYQSIVQGKVACLILAGGEGSRLRYPYPKGCFPISRLRKSLFQLFAERIAAASIYFQRPLLMLVATSDQTDAMTRSFFENHRWFGLYPSQVIFIKQGNLPLLDEEGKVFLRADGSLALGADGNGNFFSKIKTLDLARQGITMLQVISIDNPLALPYDPLLVGFHESTENEVSLYVIPRRKGEKAGAVVATPQGIRVIEYFELQETKEACWANTNILMFSLPFLESAHNRLPLHVTKKRVPALNNQEPDQPNAYKFEYFIFDIFQEAHRIGLLQGTRSQIFAPLKNYTGMNSISPVRSALCKKERKHLRQLGFALPQGKFELSPMMYYCGHDKIWLKNHQPYVKQ